MEGYTFWLSEVEEEEACFLFLFLPFLLCFCLNEQFDVSSSPLSSGMLFFRSGVESKLMLASFTISTIVVGLSAFVMSAQIRSSERLRLRMFLRRASLIAR